MNELVSIIIPAYNTEKYIKRCLDSVVNQTYKNIEIIIIDDGSTDSTFEICKGYKDQSSVDIKLFHQDNCGQVASNKKGVELSSGKYIMFIDSDDWVEKNMVERLYEEIILEQADIVQCRAEEVFPSGRARIFPEFSKKRVSNNIEALESVNYGGGGIYNAGKWNKIFKKELITPSCFSNTEVTIGEDYRFTIEMICRGQKIVFIPDVLYHYFQREDSITRKGYSGNGYAILENYTDIKDSIIGKYPQIHSSAVAYWTLQEMAVAISMVKSGIYDKMVIQKIRNDLRKEHNGYFKDKKVPLHLKICCLLSIVDPYFLILLYKYLFKKRYQIE